MIHGGIVLPNVDEQIDIFNIFHDGTMISLNRIEDKLDIVVKIPFLAELLNPQFTFFRVQLVGCQEFQYKAWGEDIAPATDLPFIKNLELGILSAKSNSEGLIVVSCWNKELGGELTIKTEDIVLYDQSNNVIDLSFLENLYNKYWDGLE